MATYWTQEEYARIAEALRYPTYEPEVLSAGFTIEVVQMARRLRVALQQLTEESKRRALALADNVKSLLDQYTGASGGGLDTDHVIQVDRIKLDPRLGLEVLEKRISAERQRLADFVGIEVHESAPAMGGINCRVCG